VPSNWKLGLVMKRRVNAEGMAWLTLGTLQRSMSKSTGRTYRGNAVGRTRGRVPGDGQAACRRARWECEVSVDAAWRHRQPLGQRLAPSRRCCGAALRRQPPGGAPCTAGTRNRE
jgi:hypothetical protein